MSGRKLANDALLGIHGESMGAATTILYAGTYEDEAIFILLIVRFLILPNKFFMSYGGKHRFRTTMAFRIANLFLKMRDGYTLNLVSPREVY